MMREIGEEGRKYGGLVLRVVLAISERCLSAGKPTMAKSCIYAGYEQQSTLRPTFAEDE